MFAGNRARSGGQTGLPGWAASRRVGRAFAASIGRSFNWWACPRNDFRGVFFLRKLFRNPVSIKIALWGARTGPSPPGCRTSDLIRSHREKAPLTERLLHLTISPLTSQRIIHLEFDRVRGHLEAFDLRHLQFDISVDEVVVEHAAVLQESAVLV